MLSIEETSPPPWLDSGIPPWTQKIWKDHADIECLLCWEYHKTNSQPFMFHIFIFKRWSLTQLPKTWQPPKWHVCNHKFPLSLRIESLSTDVREPRTATGSRMFPFLAWFCSLPRTGKALVDDCGLTLQTRWRENAPKREKYNFRLPSVAQKRWCLSSLISSPNTRTVLQGQGAFRLVAGKCFTSKKTPTFLAAVTSTT